MIVESDDLDVLIPLDLIVTMTIMMVLLLLLLTLLLVVHRWKMPGIEISRRERKRKGKLFVIYIRSCRSCLKKRKRCVLICRSHLYLCVWVCVCLLPRTSLSHSGPVDRFTVAWLLFCFDPSRFSSLTFVATQILWFWSIKSTSLLQRVLRVCAHPYFLSFRKVLSTVMTFFLLFPALADAPFFTSFNHHYARRAPRRVSHLFDAFSPPFSLHHTVLRYIVFVSWSRVTDLDLSFNLHFDGHISSPPLPLPWPHRVDSSRSWHQS